MYDKYANQAYEDIIYLWDLPPPKIWSTQLAPSVGSVTKSFANNSCYFAHIKNGELLAKIISINIWKLVHHVTSDYSLLDFLLAFCSWHIRLQLCLKNQSNPTSQPLKIAISIWLKVPVQTAIFGFDQRCEEINIGRFEHRMVKIFGELQASMGGYNLVEDKFGKRSLQLRQIASTF